MVEDLDGTYASWFDSHDCEAVAVRPDWYLFGGAVDGEALAALVDAIETALGGARVS